MKQQILDILDNYFADDAMIAEITEVLNKGVGNAVSLLDIKPVTQQEIRDWATLNGYVFIKCCSMADRLKVEKVAHEIWGDTVAGEDMWFI